MTTLSTHVLDAVTGLPAAGLQVALARRTTEGWEPLGGGATNADGRLREFAPDGIGPGVHRLVFDTGGYFAASGQTGFYPEVQIIFEVTDTTRHYHVPLLLSPYAYSTYRGS